jgi:hypothetical protein
VDPIDIMMKDTKVTGETLNQLNDWMEDIYGHQPDESKHSTLGISSEQADALHKLDQMDTD